MRIGKTLIFGPLFAPGELGLRRQLARSLGEAVLKLVEDEGCDLVEIRAIFFPEGRWMNPPKS